MPSAWTVLDPALRGQAVPMTLAHLVLLTWHHFQSHFTKFHQGSHHSLIFSCWNIRLFTLSLHYFQNTPEPRAHSWCLLKSWRNEGRKEQASVFLQTSGCGAARGRHVLFSGKQGPKETWPRALFGSHNSLCHLCKMRIMVLALFHSRH